MLCTISTSSLGRSTTVRLPACSLWTASNCAALYRSRRSHVALCRRQAWASCGAAVQACERSRDALSACGVFSGMAALVTRDALVRSPAVRPRLEAVGFDSPGGLPSGSYVFGDSEQVCRRREPSNSTPDILAVCATRPSVRRRCTGFARCGRRHAAPPEVCA